jgi:uracil-DNA glycosylase
MLPMADRLVAWDPLHWPLADDWQPTLQAFLASPVGHRLEAFLRQRLDVGATVYPPTPFHALELTPLAKVRVVVLGQDPYHGPGQSHGLAFSVPKGVRPPPSLRNLFLELDRSGLGRAPGGGVSGRRSGNLEGWASQGVLLLNACLTVEAGQPGAHAGQGWEVFTDGVLRAVLALPGPVVFMLWGARAQAKRPLIEAVMRPGPVLVLQANHPSPLSARRPPIPFIGCDHFHLANTFLARYGLEPVNWAV